MNNTTEAFVTSSRDVVRFRFIKNVSDLQDNSLVLINPTFTHQIFGYWEKIYGYKDLKIRLTICQKSFYCYLSIKYRKKITERRSYKADDLVLLLDFFIPPAFVQNKMFFKTLMKNYTVEYFGIFLQSFQHVNGQEYMIYKVDEKSKSFLKFFHRLETLIFWFIDGVNKIDIDDNNWTIYLLYEKDILVGYCTVYKFEMENYFRKRISQFLIIPTYQKLKLGTEFLKIIYNELLNETNILEITVENPCPEFQSIKDYLDLQKVLSNDENCLKPDEYGRKRLKELKLMYNLKNKEDLLRVKRMIIDRIKSTKKFAKIRDLKTRKAILFHDCNLTLSHYAKTCSKFPKRQ